MSFFNTESKIYNSDKRFVLLSLITIACYLVIMYALGLFILSYAYESFALSFFIDAITLIYGIRFGFD